MSNKTYKAIYVYGRKEDQENYKNDKPVSFAKIGQTITKCKSIDELTAEHIKQDALKRCKEQTRTAMPFVCKIFDIFISPNIKNTSEKDDDKIRNILCNDIYNINNSKKDNCDLDPDDIAAGTEFVYNVKRSNIIHAIESYDHMFFTECDAEDLSEIQKICQINSRGLDENIDDLSNDADEKNVPLTTQRGKNEYSFYKAGLKDGDTIVLRNNNAKTATVINEYEVKYVDEDGVEHVGGINDITMIASNLSYRVYGMKHWNFDGTMIADLF